ncbi:MAG: ABC transporter substrate-binding protein [Candidatus Magasanikbacteria bacterium]
MGNKNWYIPGLIILIGIAGYFTLIKKPFSDFQKKKKDTVKVGAVFSLSGKLSTYGQNTLNGVKLAVKQINESSGINGRELKLQTEGTNSESKKAVSALKKLINVNNLNIIIGPEASPLAMSMAPATKDKNVLLFGPTISAPKFNEISDYAFTAWPESEQLAEQMAEFVYRELGLRKIAILHILDDRGVKYKKNFKKRFQDLGGEITAVESFRQDSKDFRTQLTKIRETNPDGLYILALSKQYISIIEQVKELGMNDVKLLSDIGIEDPVITGNIPKLASGLIYNLAGMDRNKAETSRFIETYKKEFGEKPDTFAAHGYDSMMVLAKAMKSCEEEKKLTSECVKKQLQDINYDGVTGNIEFTSQGDVRKSTVFKIIKDGEFKLYSGN